MITTFQVQYIKPRLITYIGRKWCDYLQLYVDFFQSKWANLTGVDRVCCACSWGTGTIKSLIVHRAFDW